MKDWLIENWQWCVIAILMVALLAIVIYTVKHLHRLWKILTQPFKKGHTYRCKVIRVSDGDTVTCQKRFWSRKTATMRLAYIDAPESKQSYGSESKTAVQKLLLNKNVKVLITDVDQYGRFVGDIYVSGRSVSEQLIKQGHAWAYPTYAKNKAHREKLIAMQVKAKSQKIGMWKSRRVENPSDFRKRN